MYNNKKILALIPARGGSKRLPGKNIKPLSGKPLIAWTIEQAKKNKYVDSVIVSTENEEIAEISKKYGAYVPFLRPRELATDDAKSIDVVLHAVEWAKNNNTAYDLVLVLQPTSPLRILEDIDNAIETIFLKNAKAVISVCESEHSPLWANTLPDNGCLANFIKSDVVNKNGQQLPKFYRLNGSIYVGFCDYFLEKQSFWGSGTFAYIMPKERSVDIDDEIDFLSAEFLLEKKDVISKKMLSFKKSRRMEADFNNPYPSFPREVFFDLNNTCVSRCFFCSNAKISERACLDRQLGFKLLRDFYDNGTRDVAFHATGEPFLRNDLAEFVAKAKAIGYEYIFMNSNGILAVPQAAKPVLDAGLDSIKFSVNAGTRRSYLKVHGLDAFDNVINNIKWFSEYRKKSGLTYRIYVSMVPTSLTQGEWLVLKNCLSDYVDDMDCRSCSNQGGNMLENNSTEKIDKNNLLGSLNKNQGIGKCPDLFTRCTVTPQGFLSACVVDYQNYLVVADLHKVYIKDAWHNEVYVNLRKRHISGNLKGLSCYNCLNNCKDETMPLLPEFARPFKSEVKDEK